MMFQWRVIMDGCHSVHLAEKSKISTSLNKIKRLHLCMGVCVLCFVYVCMGDTDHHFIPSLSSEQSRCSKLQFQFKVQSLMLQSEKVNS